MAKTYQDTHEMTERAITDELQTIATRDPEEMTLNDALRAEHLRWCLASIAKARRPAKSVEESAAPGAPLVVAGRVGVFE